MRNQRIQIAAALIILLALVLGTAWSAIAQEPEPSRAAPARERLPERSSVALSSADFKAGELLVKFKQGVSSQTAESIADRYRAMQVRPLYNSNVELWTVPEGSELNTLARLNADPAVQYAEPNYRYWAVDTTPNDPAFVQQWAHTRVGSPAAWDVSTGSASIVIAIIDSGVDLGHPDLASKLVAGYDFVGLDANAADENGHGTHVAGIAAAITNNGIGVAGMDWNARIMPVRVLDETGGGFASDISSGIIWAYSHGAKVLNLSLGGYYYSQTMQDAVNSAHQAGSLVVAAMGNDNTSAPVYPAAFGNVLAVAATGPTDSKASYSNYGNHCDIAAPGGDMVWYHDPNGIYSTMPTYPVYMTTQESFYMNYDYVHGTSQAAPFVTGLASLIWSLDATLTPDEVQDTIEATAADLGSLGWDPEYGYGLINAPAALLAHAAPVAPALTPINNADGDGDYLVDWTDVPNATTYTLQEDDNPAFASPSVLYSGPASQYSVSGQAAGVWYYRVRASNAQGNSPWSDVRSTAVKPDPPVLDPITNPGNEDEYVLSWSASAGANGYVLQEDDTAAFGSPTTRYMGTALEYHVTGQPGGTWYYRARAYNDAGNSDWSTNVSTIVDLAALDAPILQPIANGDGDGDYLVEWSSVVNATTYLLEESRDPYFVNVTEVYSGTALQYAVSDHPGGHWYYRARAFGPPGRGPWSNQESAIVTSWIFLPNIVRDFGTDVTVGLPINEGFEGGVVPPSEWTQIVGNTSFVTTTWSIADARPQSGLHYATVYYDPTLAVQNEVLLSPEFHASSAQLDFYSFGSLYWCRDVYDNCDLNIWLVVGAWGSGDDVKIYTADQDWPANWVWAPSVVDLTPYLPSGTPVRIGFQYEGRDGAQIALDAINITQ